MRKVMRIYKHIYMYVCMYMYSCIFVCFNAALHTGLFRLLLRKKIKNLMLIYYMYVGVFIKIWSF